MQILHFLKSPQDAWTRIIRKVANDAVYCIFDSFKNEENSSAQRLTKDFFLQSFLKGKSTTRKLKGMTNWGNTHVGREIQVINNRGETENIFTSHLFKTPIPVLITDNQCFSNTKKVERSKFMFRHCFEHELSSCVHQIDCSKANEFSTVDQRETLLKIKAKIEKDLLYKFISSDEKIIKTLREIFLEELDNKMKTSFEKTDKKIDHVSCQVEEAAQQAEHVAHKQNDMLERLYGRVKQMEENYLYR